MARQTDPPPKRLEHRDIPARVEPRLEPQDAIRPAQGMFCAAALSAPLWVLIWLAVRRIL